jgi:methyl-accepting chemotaxis protein
VICVQDPAALGRVIDWLALIVERRDLSLAAPADPNGRAITALLDAVSREFADFREVVAGAREAGRRNAEELGTVVRSAGEQGELVRVTAAAAAEAEHGAASTADAADALHDLTQVAARAANEASGRLGAINGELDELLRQLTAGDGPLGEMRESTEGVARFITTLARLSRHAQLLGVNASIEAAHLAEAGSRFGIVAQEVRKLSMSTRESKTDVARIAAELRQSTGHIAAAVIDFKGATTGSALEIGGATDALSRTRQVIDDFEKLVATVADIAGTQSMAVQAISSSIERISHHADQAADASREAARLDVDSLLDRAQTRLDRWKLREYHPSATVAAKPLMGWIAALMNGTDNAGTDSAARTELDSTTEGAPLVAAVQTLLAHVSAEQRDVLTDVIQVAIAAARNGYAWRSISESLRSLRDEIELVRATVGESVGAAHTSADLAAQMQMLVGTIGTQYDSALQLLGGASARILHMTASVQEIDTFVGSMGAAAARADRIMGLIETLSAETDLLSLNAAIEAAHAGDLGLGFSVIAEEIRALARSTNDSTSNVSQLVARIRRLSEDLRTSIGAAAASMNDVEASAAGARSAIGNLGGSFESATERAADVSRTASEQTRALGRVLENINRSGSALDLNAATASDRSRLELAMLGSRAHTIAARRRRGTVIECVRELTETLCMRLEETIVAALGNGRISTNQLFDVGYEPIAGLKIASLARLFDVSRVPQAGFTPTKYATPWDAVIDEAMVDVLSRGWDEANAAGVLPVAIFISDLNGLWYAYPRQKIAAWTNDPAADNLGNRIKRLVEDEYTLRVGRTGLGRQAAELGPRSSYDAFRAAGCQLARTAIRPWAGYVYARDTSAVCNEVAMAVYAGDLRHSTLRVCYDANLV